MDTNLVAVLPPFAKNTMFFGGNFTTPEWKFQEVNYFPGGFRAGDKLKCSNIEIEETKDKINAVMLCKPSGSWGALMGTNDKKVAIGRVPVETKFNRDEDPKFQWLTGGDLVRLGLERGSSAEQALSVITLLLEKHGQGASVIDGVEYTDLGSDSSFLIIDPLEAWILDTAGTFWVARKFISRYIVVNGLSITERFEKHSKNMHEKVEEMGIWKKSQGRFDFFKLFATAAPDSTVYYLVDEMLAYIDKREFNTRHMHRIMRTTEKLGSKNPCNASLVCELQATTPFVTWVTCTTDADRSVYKPFVFTPNACISDQIVGKENGESGLQRRQRLYMSSHNKSEVSKSFKALKSLEDMCYRELEEYMKKIEASGELNFSDLDDLMKDCVEAECLFYV